MWQRSFESKLPAQFPRMGGDGGGLLDGRDLDVSLQHPWMSGSPGFVPDAWACTYDYPLICYLHDDGRSEQDLWRWFPAISDQNYIGVGVRAPFLAQSSMPGQFRWRGQRPDATAAVVTEAIELVLGSWNIHPERIYLFGEGAGALAAIQLLLLSQYPQDENEIRFAGAICRNLPAWWARALPPVADFAAGRVLLLDPQTPKDDGEAPAAIDGLNESGLTVTLGNETQQSPAGMINQWIMSGISTAVS